MNRHDIKGFRLIMMTWQQGGILERYFITLFCLFLLGLSVLLGGIVSALPYFLITGASNIVAGDLFWYAPCTIVAASIILLQIGRRV